MPQLFNEQFLLGVVVNKDRENNEKLMGGLMASQFRPNSMVGVVLQKNQADRITELEGQVKSITADRDRLKAPPAPPVPPAPPPPPPTGLSTGLSTGTSTPAAGGTQAPGTPQSAIDATLAILALTLSNIQNERDELRAAIQDKGSQAFDLARSMTKVPTLTNHSTSQNMHGLYEASYNAAITQILDQLKCKFMQAFSLSYPPPAAAAAAPAPAPPVPPAPPAPSG